MKHTLITFAAITSLALAANASATVYKFTGALTAAAESPPTASSGSGTTIVTIDNVLNTMEVAVAFIGLTGGNTAAHIHCCTPTPNTGTAGVATVTPTFTGFPAGQTSGFYDHTFDMTSTASYNSAFINANGGTAASAFAVLLAGMLAGDSYLNIHTPNNPSGEIRSFLTVAAVPLPASAWLLASGLAGMLLVSRSRNSALRLRSIR